ncbi:hypothetical protein [Xylophilus sp. GOD-11R]|uniref:hypothetical protein n=1 Tax=Xylophilus sp. GOD-11R TaxID=3089814 RepID=UPI00298C8C2E|nr:hypothetical protein [Xylophilus sp. GOD-11R]WPB55369.1 hypothetical protein R9X41_14585 [Xylophilus sp. GOD-11R]
MSLTARVNASALQTNTSDPIKSSPARVFNNRNYGQINAVGRAKYIVRLSQKNPFRSGRNQTSLPTLASLKLHGYVADLLKQDFDFDSKSLFI